MIFVEMSGGLGNQIFQYCAGRLFQSKNGDNVAYHYTAMTAADHDNREIAIDKFYIADNWNRIPDAANLFSGYKFREFIFKLSNFFTVKLYGNLSKAGEKEKWFFRLKWNVLNRFGIYFQQFDYCFPIKKSWFKNNS